MRKLQQDRAKSTTNRLASRADWASLRWSSNVGSDPEIRVLELGTLVEIMWLVVCLNVAVQIIA